MHFFFPAQFASWRFHLKALRSSIMVEWACKTLQSINQSINQPNDLIRFDGDGLKSSYL